MNPSTILYYCKERSYITGPISLTCYMYVQSTVYVVYQKRERREVNNRYINHRNLCLARSLACLSHIIRILYLTTSTTTSCTIRYRLTHFCHIYYSTVFPTVHHFDNSTKGTCVIISYHIISYGDTLIMSD